MQSKHLNSSILSRTHANLINQGQPKAQIPYGMSRFRISNKQTTMPAFLLQKIKSLTDF